jgi:hypothetical protein
MTKPEELYTVLEKPEIWKMEPILSYEHIV